MKLTDDERVKLKVIHNRMMYSHPDTMKGDLEYALLLISKHDEQATVMPTLKRDYEEGLRKVEDARFHHAVEPKDAGCSFSLTTREYKIEHIDIPMMGIGAKDVEPPGPDWRIEDTETVLQGGMATSLILFWVRETKIEAT